MPLLNVSVLISAPRLGVVDSVCLYVHLAVCLSCCSFKSILRVCRWNRATLWPSFLHVALYKTFLDFWFRPFNAINLLPKICTKSPKSACTATRLEMFGPTRGFSGMADSMEPCKVWGRPLLPWHWNWARRGDPVAYQLVPLPLHLPFCLTSLLFQNYSRLV